MRRREFIKGISSLAIAWPLAARAQQPTMPIIGFLRNTKPEDSVDLLMAFRQGLKETGYVEGQNMAIKYRWAAGQFASLPALAADLVRHPVAVIVAGGDEAIRAAKAATPTVPIVFASGEEPIALGFVASLNRPDGNLTGASFFAGSATATKRMELLHALVPKVATVAFLVNPNFSGAELQVSELQRAVRALGLQILVLHASSERDFEPAFATLVQQRAGALVVGGDALILSQRAQLIVLAARHAIPTIYTLREFPASGGLMSYGSSIADTYRQAGVYTGRILKGAKPADLPVMLPTKLNLVINRTVANALGLNIPDKLLALADEVIE